MKKVLGIAVAMAAWVACANTPPAITNVRASQREGTKLVDIYYDAADADGDLLKVRIEISDNDGAKYSVPAFSLTGDIGEGIAPGTGKHIVWDAGTDWDGEYSDQMRVKVFAIDAQGFPGMEWGNEVPPGGFLMGQDGGAEGSGPSRHVNIPWSYWLGKYEVTAQQYCDFLNAALVSGHVTRNGSTSEVYIESGMLPGCNGNYKLLSIGDGQSIRWNVNNFEVVGSSTNLPILVTQVGALAFCRYYGYDLPTDAEWEKAARGPDHDDQDEHLVYPWGNTINGGYANYWNSGDPYGNGLTPVGYYDGNQTPVGPDTVNGYGLYDVIGNAAEWTRSYSGDSYSIESYDQQESLYSARNRNLGFGGIRYVTRGGAHDFTGDYLKLYYRLGYEDRNSAGFRVVRRSVPDIGSAKLLVKETFESWNTFTNTTGMVSIDSSIGAWSISNSISCVANDDNKYLHFSAGTSRLYLPNDNQSILYIRFKARAGKAADSNTPTIYFRTVLSDGSTWYNSIRPLSTDFVCYSLIAKDKDVCGCYIESSVNGSQYTIDIDDLEIWTIPRAASE